MAPEGEEPEPTTQEIAFASFVSAFDSDESDDEQTPDDSSDEHRRD